MFKSKTTRLRTRLRLNGKSASLSQRQIPAVLWGVDSARTANSPGKDGTVAAFDLVAQRAGVAPAFWGRYIGGLYSITAPEVAFLRARGTKILLIYNGAKNSPQSVQGGVDRGQADGKAAVNAISTIAVPQGVAIFADIESSWTVTPEWIQGWVIAIRDRGYVPGLYGDCQPSATFAKAYSSAISLDSSVETCFLWTMEPEPFSDCRAGTNAPAYAPASPSEGVRVDLWQYKEGCWEDILGATLGVDMNLATAAAISLMW